MKQHGWRSPSITVTPSPSIIVLTHNDDVDVLSASWWDDKIAWYENVRLMAGDANCDFRFDQEDIVQVLASAKYLTGEAATWSEGDWNEDGQFDQRDIMAALQTGSYMQGPYVEAAITGQAN